MWTLPSSLTLPLPVFQSSLVYQNQKFPDLHRFAKRSLPETIFYKARGNEDDVELIGTLYLFDVRSLFVIFYPGEVLSKSSQRGHAMSPKVSSRAKRVNHECLQFTYYTRQTPSNARLFLSPSLFISHSTLRFSFSQHLYACLPSSRTYAAL